MIRPVRIAALSSKLTLLLRGFSAVGILLVLAIASFGQAELNDRPIRSISIVFPNGGHGSGGSPYGERRRIDFFVRC